MLRPIRALLALSGKTTHVLGVNARNRAVIYTQNRRRHYPLVDDKLRTKEILSAADVPVPATLRVFSSMHEAKHAPALLGELEDFVIKPARGSGGNGILVLVERTGEGWLDHGGTLHTPRHISRHVSNIIFGNYAHGLADRAMAEERLVQAALLGDGIFPGLPDVRVITLGGTPRMAMLRVPTKRSHGKANLHQGAVGVGVDLRTGRANHASFRGVSIRTHPDTGTPLVGSVVTQWGAILDVARRAAAALPLGYLGIDIALDVRRGPLVLEANVRPGLEIQNANHRGLRGTLSSLAALGVSR